jgi:hypothetical protein
MSNSKYSELEDSRDYDSRRASGDYDSSDDRSQDYDRRDYDKKHRNRKEKETKVTMYNSPTNMDTIHIKEFTFDLMMPNTANYMDPEQGGGKYVVIGKPGTGKSTLISAILYAKKHIFPCAMVMSGTEDSNDFYKKKMPDTFVFSKYEEPQLESMIRRQRIAKKHLDNPWVMCIIDDCTDNPAVFTKPIQGNLFKNGRHMKFLYLVSLQYSLDVRPAIRTSVDGTFIFKETNLKSRRSLWENYAGGVIPDFHVFCSILDQICDNHTALYIRNDPTVSNTMENGLFFVKATPPPANFKFGCPDIYQFHYDRYNPDYIPPVV